MGPCLSLCLPVLDGTPEAPTWETTVPFVPPVREGIVIKVYDGDTVTVASRLPGMKPMFRFSVRLADIDTPEVRDRDPDLKRRAIDARDTLRGLVLGSHVTLDVHRLDKYGRLLAHVRTDDGTDLSSFMLRTGHAVPYPPVLSPS